MLTVKLVEPNGHEQIHEVKNVWTSPNDPNTKVLAELSDGSRTLQFGTLGTVYVMNGEGNTIAKYNLGE